MNHVISLLVENNAGVLARISGLLSGRGYNVESFSSGPTLDPDITRITLVCRGDDTIIDQIKKQLNRLIEVIKVSDLTNKHTIDRQFALLKLLVQPGNRGEIIQLAEVFAAKVMDVGSDTMILELTGSEKKIEDLVQLLDGNIVEIARSGLVSIERGRKHAAVSQK
ncbi:MAG: acetolactate synthase small subunit [Spirochaetales bacterium]|nr:acetolactate synthase small subunit [Spirochaetales bacterium]